MRVSQKSEYALRAMLELCENNDHLPVRTADIAKRQRIPEKFLELILVELRRAGLIISRRGPDGGHQLAKRPEEIFVGEVWRAIEGGLKTSPVPSKRDDHFKFVWRQVDEAVANVVDNISFRDVMRRAEKEGVADFSI
jgi:Rrf2 family protein